MGKASLDLTLGGNDLKLAGISQLALRTRSPNQSINQSTLEWNKKPTCYLLYSTISGCGRVSDVVVGCCRFTTSYIVSLSQTFFLWCRVACKSWPTDNVHGSVVDVSSTRFYLGSSVFTCCTSLLNERCPSRTPLPPPPPRHKFHTPTGCGRLTTSPRRD